MGRHFQREMDQINSDLYSLFGHVEKMIHVAVQALCDRRPELVETVIEMDSYVDFKEVAIEEEGLKILALHQPVATDLRRVTTILKIINELERIADLACNIAERSKDLHLYFPYFPSPEVIPEMATHAVEMVRSSLDAFANQDAERAKEVIRLDDQVDRLNREAIESIVEMMKENPELVEPSLHCFSAVRHIERIGDHAENIAEDVVYLIDGEIIRHKHGDALSPETKKMEIE